MTSTEFLEKIQDLIGEYTYGNDKYEDVDDGGNIRYNNQKGTYAWSIEIEHNE